MAHAIKPVADFVDVTPALAPAVTEPTGNDIIRNLFRDRSPAALIGGCEAFLGLLVGSFVAFCVVGMYGGMVLFNAWASGYPRVERGLLIALTVAWLPLAIAEWRSVVHYTAGLARVAHPVPVNLALTMLRPGRSMTARVAAALWWLANAALIILLAHAFTESLAFFDPQGIELVVQYVVPVIVLLGAAFAVNTHVLIAVHALTRSERLVRGLWRVRVLLDLALALLVPNVNPDAFGLT